MDTGREMRGGQWQALHLMRGLKARGFDSLLRARPGGGLQEAAEAEGLVAPGRSYNLIHAHDARSHGGSSFLRKPLVVSRRVAFPPQRNLLSRWKYSRADRYLAVSEFVKAQLIDAGVRPTKIDVVPDGVQIPPPPNFDGRTLMLALDSADPLKRKALIQRAAALAGIPVHFSRDLAADLPRALVFLYISEMEGLGSAALMAMAHGAAVIASRVGGLPEIVRDGETGTLVENDVEQIGLAMASLLTDRMLARSLAQKGRNMVEQHFTIDRMVDRTVAAYQKALE